MATKRNKKGRAVGGMLVGSKVGIEMMEKEVSIESIVEMVVKLE